MRRNGWLWVLLGVLATANLAQAYRIMDLRGRMAVLKGESRLKPGTAMLPLGVLARGGHRIEIPAKGPAPLVVYLMSPTCSWCQRNEAVFRSLVRHLQGRMRIVVVVSSSEDTLKYDAVGRLGVPISGEVDAETSRAFRFGGTPETILIGADGRVLEVWSGAYMGAMKKEIESRLSVTLPDVGEARSLSREVAPSVMRE